MKKLYSIMASAIIGAFSATASAQEYIILEDLTSKIQNADFSADEPINGLVRTYAKDLADEGLGNGGEEMYGQQAVNGWTAVYLTDNIKHDADPTDDELKRRDGKAAGVFAYIIDDASAGQLGGSYYAPDITAGYEYMSGGKALGMVSVWGCPIQYTQSVTLPAGSYAMVVPTVNTAGTGVLQKNYNGFITDAGVEYLSTKTAFEVDKQENDVITFTLTEETSGVISLGCSFGGGSGSAPHLFIDCVNLYSADLTPQLIAEAKATLLALIEEGEELGADTSAAQAVYDDDNASLEDVQAAVESQKAINGASQTDLSESFITNPHFNIGEVIEDGITTYDYDMEKNGVAHYGMQPVTGWVASDPEANARACGVFGIGSSAFLGGPGYQAPSVMSDGSAEGNVLGFVSVWGAKSQYTQRVTIPAGQYTFSVSYYNAGGSGAVAKNLMGFIADSGEEYLCEVTQFKEKSWEKMRVYFELDYPTSGVFTLGYTAANAGSGSMPHFFIDGITLNFVGQVSSPAHMALEAKIMVLDSYGSEIFSQATRDVYEALMGDANKVLDGTDDEAMEAMTARLTEIETTIQTEIAAYKTLEALMNTLERETMDETLTATGNLSEMLSAMYVRVAEAYGDMAYSIEDINAAIAEHDEMIPAEIRRVLNSGEGAGTYLTALLKNPDFDDNANGWSGTVPTTRAGVAEFYNKTFDMYQVIEGLPNGEYKISLSGFHRYDNTDNTAAAHRDKVEDEYIAAYIYGNEQATKFKSIFDGASTEDVKTGTNSKDEEVQYVYYVDDMETEFGYIPFSMEGFAVAESVTRAYDTSALALVTDGTLRVGVRCTNNPSSAAWTIFDSFRIQYVGNEPSNYVESIKKAVDVYNEKVDNAILGDLTSSLPNETLLNRDKLCGEANALVENPTTVDDCIAMLGQLKDATAHVDEVVALLYEYDEVMNYYGDAVEYLEIVYPEIDDYYSKQSWETEAELAEDIKAMHAGWAAIILEDAGTATLDNPVEVTNMLRNPNFTWCDNDTKKHWTIANDYGDAAESLIEFYGKPTWSISQNVYGLIPGYYTLTVKGFYRPCQQLTDVVKQRVEGNEHHDVFIFASNGEKEWSSEIINILDSKGDLSEVVVEGANRNATIETDLVTAHRTYEAGTTLISPTGHAYTRAYFDAGYGDGNSVDFQVKEGDVITLGAKKVEGNTDGGNWTTLDDFQLFYLGTTAPTAINAAHATGTATAQAYYTAGGVCLSRMQKGLNIIVTTMADGTRRTTKAIVK